MMQPTARLARHVARVSAIALTALVLSSCGGGSDNNIPTPPLFGTTVVFGASLSDTGNCAALGATACPPSPPYATRRFSNGPLFVEQVAARYGASVAPSSSSGTNFAYAGARTGAIPGLATQSTTPSMVQQLDQYVSRQAGSGAISARTLFVVDASTFGNNITAGLPLIQGGTITPTQLIGAGITDVVTIMTRLYSLGARHILVVNAPNIGLTPLAQSQGATVVGATTQISGGFAQNLALTIQQQQPSWPGLNVYQLDLFTFSNQVTAAPASFGLSNVTAPCVVGTTVCTNPEGYLYWDPFHPTAAAGALIAQRINTLLPAPQ